jgi:hypothetical protein
MTMWVGSGRRTKLVCCCAWAIAMSSTPLALDSEWLVFLLFRLDTNFSVISIFVLLSFWFSIIRYFETSYYHYLWTVVCAIHSSRFREVCHYYTFPRLLLIIGTERYIAIIECYFGTIFLNVMYSDFFPIYLFHLIGSFLDFLYLICSGTWTAQ